MASLARFVPRASFPSLALPRSYFLGHHKAALDKLATRMTSTDLILECRDYRIPLSSRNPILEERFAHKSRIVVYMKQDLGSNFTRADEIREKTIREWHAPHPVHFVQATSGQNTRRTVHTLIKTVRDFAATRNSLRPATMIVVGMPNVGKSTLLNGLRAVGMGSKTKAAKTGDMPGVTRAFSSGVKILQGDSEAETVYLNDMPGVFVPYVPDDEAMLKLALCGMVKDFLIPPITMADYCLYAMNRENPTLYASAHPPTNDILELLTNLAKKMGRLKSGSEPDLESAAVWFIRRWREGKLGNIVLDEVTSDALSQQMEKEANPPPSLNQARKMFKQEMRERSAAKFSPT